MGNSKAQSSPTPSIEDISKCHGVAVKVGQGNGGKFYICTKCDRPCDQLIITEAINQYTQGQVLESQLIKPGEIIPYEKFKGREYVPLKWLTDKLAKGKG